MKNNKWTGGRILAFSGVDGKTDFVNGLVLRSSFKFPGFEIKFNFPEQLEIILEGTPGKLSLFGDWFEYGDMSGSFIDAHHFIIRGKCRFISENEKIKHITQNGKTLLGRAEYFNEKLIESDVAIIIKERKNWGEKIIAEKRNTGRYFANALSQIKTQIYSPEDAVKHYWTTPDRWPHKRMCSGCVSSNP